jgi:hypothetical protein
MYLTTHPVIRPQAASASLSWYQPINLASQSCAMEIRDPRPSKTSIATLSSAPSSHSHPPTVPAAKTEAIHAATAMASLDSCASRHIARSLDSLVSAQALMDLRREQSSSSATLSEDTEDTEAEELSSVSVASSSPRDPCSPSGLRPQSPPQHGVPFQAQHGPTSAATLLGMNAAGSLGQQHGFPSLQGGTRLSQVALIDMQMRTMLHDYALKRMSLLSQPVARTTGLGAQLQALAMAHVAAATASTPPSPTHTGLDKEVTPPTQKKVVLKRPRSPEPWVVKSWTIKGRPSVQSEPTRDSARRSTCRSKRTKTDASGAPPQPPKVHMVCLPANDSKEGGCGCRQTTKPILEHSGLADVGEWHVVTQPHFNCPRGSFRPAKFRTACDDGCGCSCHADVGVDPADCNCNGSWERVGADEWVKTTTAPTANGWKDRRAKYQEAKGAEQLAVQALEADVVNVCGACDGGDA